MKEIELTQIKAMLQEIAASIYRDRRSTSAIMSIGTAEQPDWDKLGNLGELTEMVQATRKALPVMHEGKIDIDNPVWSKFETLYYQSVIKPVFSGLATA